MTFYCFSFYFIDIEKTFHGVPPLVENGEIVEVQVLEEGEIFDPQEFLDGLAQHSNGNKTLRRHVREERHQYSVRLLGVLQMPSQALFCQLWCERH